MQMNVRLTNRILATVALSLVAAVTSTGAAQATSGHGARSHRHVLASQTFTPGLGGLLRAKGGVSIYVPPGVMSRRGKVTIAEVRRHVYDIHIHAPWHGTVAVSLPLRRRGHNAIVHRFGQLWVAEGRQRGERTVWVTQLSWFTDVATKVGSKLSGALCLKFSWQAILECAGKKGLKFVDGKLADWIFARLPDSCKLRLAYAGITAAKGGPFAVFFAVLITDNVDGLCIVHAGETGGHAPTSPAPTQPTTPPNQTTPPKPTPSPPGQPAPPPAPSSRSETTGGVTHTWTNYTNAGGTEGPTIPSNQTVQIACKLLGFRVADGNTWWYRIASSPWNGAFYASADAFYNNGQTSGSLHGTPFVDPSVPDC